MKKLLFTVLTLSAFALYSANEKPAAPAKGGDKVEAKTKASPKANGKKAPKAKAKSTAFQAYDAGEWKPVDNKKGHLLGYKLSNGDLMNQPVLIVKFDPEVEVSSDDRESDPKYIYQFTGWETKVQPHLQVVNVPAREIAKDDLPLLGKIAGKTAAIPGFPWYRDFGLVKEPENPTNTYPFYYVVSTEGKVIYAGNKGKIAQSEVYGSLKKSGEFHPLYGFVKPAIHTNICANLGLGTNCMAEVKKLDLLAKKGSEESMAEAKAILGAIDQSKTYHLKQLIGIARSEPQKALMMADVLLKTFPRDKAKFAEAAAALKNNPTVKQTLPMFKKLALIAIRLDTPDAPPMKKAELTKAYQEALKGERLCNKFHKEAGDGGNIPMAIQAFENLVQTVKAGLEAQGAGAK